MSRVEVGRKRAILSLRLRLRSGLRQQGGAFGAALIRPNCSWALLGEGCGCLCGGGVVIGALPQILEVGWGVVGCASGHGGKAICRGLRWGARMQFCRFGCAFAPAF